MARPSRRAWCVPRVVFIGHSAAMSGAEIALVRQLDGLGDHIEAKVILGEDGPLVAAIESLGIHPDIIRLPDRTRQLRRSSVGDVRSSRAMLSAGSYSVRLARRLRKLRPDLVEANSLKSILYGTAAARLAGRPIVWHVRDRISDDYLPTRAVRLIHAIEPLASGIIANSGATRATLRRSSEAVVIPSSVAGRLFEVPRAGRVGVVGLVGRIASWKGQLEFVEAFDLAFSNSDVKARIIGSPTFGRDDEAYYTRLVEKISTLRSRDRIELRGFQHDIAAELAELSIVVHASTIPEPFGLVVAEAMASGRPVIASGAGGPAEMIKHGVTGLLTPPGDVQRLAQAMKRLNEDSALRQKLATAAREDARQYTPEQLTPRYLDLYRRLTDTCA